MIFDPVTGVCANCGKHKATTRWVGEGSTLDLVHGFYQVWCECCCLKAQLDHARKSEAEIPEIERRLAEVRCEEIDPVPARGQ